MKVFDAATIVLLRLGDAGPSVLMGQRGAGAVFMPSKFVFPGGRVDDADAAGDPGPLHPATHAALDAELQVRPETLAVAAMRELVEETGQRLRDASRLRMIFRAVTPPGRPRRFDARFLLGHADDLVGDPDDFGAADAELSHLHWVPLHAARALDVPFVTEVVLGEVAAHHDGSAALGVPFLDNRGETTRMTRL